MSDSEHDTDSDNDDTITHVTKKHQPTSSSFHSGHASRLPQFQRQLRPQEDDYDEDDFDRQIRLEETKKLQADAEQLQTKVDEDGTVYEWDPNVKGWFPKVPEEFLVEHHMNYGLENFKGIRYDSKLQTYIYETKQQDEDENGNNNLTYKLNKDNGQWVPIMSTADGTVYSDPKTNVKYTFDLKKNSFIPSVSTYTAENEDNRTYVWNKDTLSWMDLSTTDAYTDHLTGYKYKWNQENNKWDIDGIEELDKATDVIEEEQQSTSATDDQNNKKREGWFEVPDEKNCNVYVSGLPYDIDDKEFEELMSKYGIIEKDQSDYTKKKVKLYRDNEGKLKGDGRCCYLKPESVALCLQLLEGLHLRNSIVHVQRAKFEMKGNYNPELKPKPNKNKRKKGDKKKQKQKQIDKLLDWEERPDVVRGKHERIIVMRNMFDLEQFKNDPTYIIQLRSNIRQSCEQYGEVKKIYIFDTNPDGIVTVGYTEIPEADECIKYMNNRIWHGRLIQCEIWDGKTKYDVQATADDEKRIDDWHKFLMEDA
ncbi:unnamed protein product [Didymodactylos carnosus]|uniref:RRM domain-containing protein n=1 Tax=Didymodactylos carnosus TaxID=1234261 RepID=A0A813PEB8_9BILA|nr:unnamed protein product [Didymodactylos carnosus]CAF0764832.1 unnamed protein product [Didymodactylos carnosus]CAF3531245.1 unnamed protein product [Didymodactylos carnosus]CAF3544879.1 unnamed protein product [Didymodactylos carnosus]